MSAHEITRIDDVSAFSDVETVDAVAHETPGGVEWRYDRDVHLRAGDAMENPPIVARPGDRCTLRIIRGYRATTGRAADA